MNPLILAQLRGVGELLDDVFDTVNRQVGAENPAVTSTLDQMQAQSRLLAKEVLLLEVAEAVGKLYALRSLAGVSLGELMVEAFDNDALGEAMRRYPLDRP